MVRAFRRTLLVPGLMALGLACLSADSASAITITRNFVPSGNLFPGGQTAGAAPGNAAGPGNLIAIFNAAADCWELAIRDTFNVTINFGWGAQATAGTLAAHSLVSQGGVPNRETAGQIIFDNDGSSVFFLDGTPLDNSEYTTYTETFADLGGGSLNVGRNWTGATGFAAGRIDLFSVAMHEIGHALGLSAANTAYQAETGADNTINVTGPRPFAGSAIPSNNSGIPSPPGTFNAHLNLPTALMFPTISNGERNLQSAADILANGQISQFTNLNLNPHAAVPEPATLAVFGAMAVGAFGLRRRSKSSAAA